MNNEIILLIVAPISATAIVITLFLAYLYPGRLIFLRPTEISFTSITVNAYGTGNTITKNLIGIPITVINTGAIAQAFQVSLIVRYDNKYSVLSNDYEINTMPSNFLLNKLLIRLPAANKKFQDAVDLNYASGFAINPRDKMLKFVFFQPTTDKNIDPITFEAGKEIELFLLYRKKVPSYNTIGKLAKNKNEAPKTSPCLSDISLKELKWKYAFKIIWKTPKPDNISNILNGGLFSVTRFNFEKYKIYPFNRNFDSFKNAPLDLVFEDKI